VIPADWPLRLYPPSFRERYGTEMQVLVEDVGGRRITLDLLLGAARAWIRPVIAGDPSERRRRRLQATVSTSWVCWCVGSMAAPAITRVLLDPPVAGADESVRHLLNIAQIGFFVGAVLALIAAAPLAGALLAPAVRRRDRRLLGPLAPAFGLALFEGVGLAVIAVLRRGHPASWPHPSIPFVIVGSAWALGFLALVGAGALGPPVVLGRARPPDGVLRWAVLVGVLVALSLLVITVASTTAAVIAGPDLFSVPVVVVACGPSAATLTSSARAITGFVRG
jgi:MFS family permease